MKRILVTIGFLFLNSCATMFNSGSQPVHLATSNGEKVKVQVTTPKTSFVTIAPTTIHVAPSTFSKLRVKVIDEQYEKVEVVADESLALSFFLNPLNFGFGLPVDIVSGKMWNYEETLQIPLSVSASAAMLGPKNSQRTPRISNNR